MHASILRYFASVARTGSIRKASEELHVATSALSRQIRKLEEELGLPLFERVSDGLRLTKAGMIVLEHARETLLHFDVMKGALGDIKGKMTGRVNIACLDSMMMQFLPETVIDFNRRHPAVDFRVRADNFGNIFNFIAEGDVDIGVTFDVGRPHDLKLLFSVPMPLMAIVARDHPLARQKKVTLQECAQFKMLLQLDNEVMTSMISVELGTLERVGRNFISTNNQMMLKPLILGGNGVAFYTPLGFLKELQSKEIVALPLAGWRIQNPHVGVIVPRTRKLTHASEEAAAFLCDRLKTFAASLEEALS